jgi:hypothetical protein
MSRKVDVPREFSYNAGALYDAWCNSISLIAAKGGLANRAGKHTRENRKEDLFRGGSQGNPWNKQAKGV